MKVGGRDHPRTYQVKAHDERDSGTGTGDKSQNRSRDKSQDGRVSKHAHRLCRRAGGDPRDHRSMNHLWHRAKYKDCLGQIHDRQCMDIIQCNIGLPNVKPVVGNSVYAPLVHEASIANRVEMVQANQHIARRCYEVSLKTGSKRVDLADKGLSHQSNIHFLELDPRQIEED
ncbi:hypothetical protein CR513_13232, partial [Mucuna pruriens]